MTAVVLGVLVAAPAVYDAGFEPTMTLAVTAPAAKPAAAFTEVAISPARIDVVAVREPNIAWALHDPSKPCRPEV